MSRRVNERVYINLVKPCARTHL